MPELKDFLAQSLSVLVSACRSLSRLVALSLDQETPLLSWSCPGSTNFADRHFPSHRHFHLLSCPPLSNHRILLSRPLFRFSQGRRPPLGRFPFPGTGWLATQSLQLPWPARHGPQLGAGTCHRHDNVAQTLCVPLPVPSSTPFHDIAVEAERRAIRRRDGQRQRVEQFVFANLSNATQQGPARRRIRRRISPSEHTVVL
jgi:hypothetical protein